MMNSLETLADAYSFLDGAIKAGRSEIARLGVLILSGRATLDDMEKHKRLKDKMPKHEAVLVETKRLLEEGDGGV